MVMCSNCHKRVAVIFVTKYENEKKVSKGLCIKCAKEMGISEKSFHSTMTRTKQDKTRKWTFEKTYVKDMEK